MMVLKSIGVFSMGKVTGCAQALVGLIFGGFMTLLAMAGIAAGGQGGIEAAIFGVGAVVIMPIMFGIFGFIGGIITAVVYNIVLSLVGGLELEFESQGYQAAEEYE